MADDEYRALVADSLPRPIRSQEDLVRTEGKINELLSLQAPSPAQEELLDLLSTLVETWETDHIPMPEVNGVAMLKALLDENQLRQKDVAPLFGSRSVISDVLGGKRELSKAHIAKLAAFFHVSPAVFFPVPKSERVNRGRIGRRTDDAPLAVAASEREARSH